LAASPGEAGRAPTNKPLDDPEDAQHRANLDLMFGAQLFSGRAESEYSRLSDVYFAQVQWFF
jgi:hypothetical protein